MTATPVLVVFDVDGTLVDSQDQIHAAMRAAFAAVGRPAPALPAILRIVGLSLPQAMAVLAPEISAPELDRLTDAYKANFSTQRAAVLAPLYPGARAALDALGDRPGTILGVATGKSRRGLGHILESHRIADRFATLQVADDHPSKPHPAMLLQALAETGIAPGRAVMVGDTRFDIDMGRAAGFRTIGVSWGYHPAEELAAAGADAVIDHFSDLMAAIDKVLA